MVEFVAGEAWAAMFTSYRRSAWRFECQGEYREPYEAEPMRQWLAGETCDLSFMESWLDGIRASVAAGRTIGRVRVLTEPLTDYLRWEMAVAEVNADAGENILVLDANRADELGLGSDDFWIFDDEVVAVMQFSADGFVGATLERDPDVVDRYRRIRDIACEHAVPFREHPALLRSP